MLRSGVTKPGHLGVGGVRQQQVDAGQPEPGEGAEVGEDAVERKLVHLEVAGVHQRARRRVHGDGERVGDRVVDRHELAVERPGDVVVAGGDLDQRRLDPVLAQLGRDQGEGEPRPDQRDVPAHPQQVGHGADVVLVPVGEDDGVDVVEPVLDHPEVREDQVDPRLLGLGEEDTAVDDQQAPGELEHGHVAADLAQPPERHDAQPAVGQGRRSLQLQVRLGELTAHEHSSPALVEPSRRCCAHG